MRVPGNKCRTCNFRNSFPMVDSFIINPLFVLPVRAVPRTERIIVDSKRKYKFIDFIARSIKLMSWRLRAQDRIGRQCARQGDIGAQELEDYVEVPIRGIWRTGRMANSWHGLDLLYPKAVIRGRSCLTKSCAHKVLRTRRAGIVRRDFISADSDVILPDFYFDLLKIIYSRLRQIILIYYNFFFFGVISFLIPRRSLHATFSH